MTAIITQMTISHNVAIRRRANNRRKNNITIALLLSLLIALPALARAEGPGFGEQPRMSDGGGDFNSEDFRRFKQKMRQQRQQQKGAPGEGQGQGQGLGRGQGDGAEGGKIQRFLKFMKSYQEVITTTEGAVGLAALGIKNQYREQGNPLGAVAELEEQLKSAKKQSIRNILLYAIRNVYEENGKQTELLAINQRILKENIQ